MELIVKKRAPQDVRCEILCFINIIKERLNEFIKDHPHTDLCCDISTMVVGKIFPLVDIKPSYSTFINKEEMYSKYEHKQMIDVFPRTYKNIRSSR